MSYFSVGDETTNSPFVPAFIRVAHVSLPLGRKERTGPFFSDGARLIARYDMSTARNDGGGGQIKVELYLIRVKRESVIQDRLPFGGFSRPPLTKDR